MNLKIINIRFSREYFPTFEDCAKWLDLKKIEFNKHTDLENVFVFHQIEKDKFADNSIQEYILDNGIKAEIGVTKENPVSTIDGVQDLEINEPTIPSNSIEPTELESLKAIHAKQAIAISELLIKLTDLTKPIVDLKNSVNVSFSKKNEKSDKIFKKVTFTGHIIKSVEDERIVYGEVLVPDEVDAQEHIYSAEEVKKAAHFWMKEFSQMGIMHKDMLGESQISILESFIAPVSFKFSENEDDDTKKVKKGTWLLKVFVEDDEVWEQVKDGELNGFSIGGVATVEDIE